MRPLTDTAPEAQKVLDAAQRSMPAWRKWETLNELHRFGRELHAAGVLSRTPSATSAQIKADWMTNVMGIRIEFAGKREERRVEQPADFRSTVEHVIAILDRVGIAYALGGSLASSIHGVTRNTIVADLCVEPFPGKEAVLVGGFGPDYYISLDAVKRAVAERSSFNIIQTTAGYKVDVFVQKERPFEHSLMARRQLVNVPGPASRPIQVVSPEDIVLLKLEWYRLGNEVSDRQWADVLGVLRIQAGAGRLDREYLDTWANQLGVADLLDRARAEAGEG